MNDDIECNWFTASADSVVYEYIRVFHWFGEAGAYCAQVLTGEVNEWKYWFFYTDYAMVIGLKHRTLQNDDHLYNILWKLFPNVLAFFSQNLNILYTLFSLFLAIFWCFSWFLRYLVNESLWNMQSLQSIWGVENLVFYNFWHIFTRKIMTFFAKIMTFYHDFSDNFHIVWVPS